jgi:alpha-glucosidase (family GH31 glycosyl hydrolase)
VPEFAFPRPKDRISLENERLYDFVFLDNDFGFKIIRISDGEAIFDTSVSPLNSMAHPLIFKDNYLEISTRIPNNANIYGLGESVAPFRRNSAYTRQTMWTRDDANPENKNVYGVHPFHLEMRNGKAHGVFLLNSNGMDVIIEQNALTYKVLGGILDFYIFLGPNPNDVISQYYAVIGKPPLPPLWAFGFHHCRYGYQNIAEVKEVVRKYNESGLYLETMWTDIDYMDNYKDFTFDPIAFPLKEMNDFISELHERGQKYVLIIDPAIKVENDYKPYVEGLMDDIFVKSADNSIFLGKVWPGLTVFPDFYNPKTQQYWTKWITEFLGMLNLDGLWIDMNEPGKVQKF